MLLSVDVAPTSGVGDPNSGWIRPPAPADVSPEDAWQPPDVEAPPFLEETGPYFAPPPNRAPTLGARDVSVVSRPAIFLSDQDGYLLSSLDAPVSTGDGLYFGTGPAWTVGATNGGPTTLAKQDHELTPDGMAGLPAVPWTRDASIKGTLTSDQSWMTFRVPVGPRTNRLRMDVRPGPEGPGPAAMVDQMFLIGPGGKVIASVAGVASFAPGGRQSLVVSLQSAPAGGTLVVRMVHPSLAPPAASTEPGDPSDVPDGQVAFPLPDFDGPADFMVDVQREDINLQASGSTPGASILIVPLVSYAPAPIWSTGGNISVAPSSGTGAPSNPIEPIYTVNTSNRHEDDRTPTAPVDDDAEAPSITLGPLISRGSSPMGPALATSIDDPAPSIRRHDAVERDRALAGPTEAELLAARNGDGRSDDGGAPGGELTALKGLGGFPLLVASGRGRRAQEQADALAATLREHDGPSAEIAASAEDAPLAPAERANRDEEVARAGLATRAVGFVIALGLASGPLYPDLVALARRKLSRRRKGKVRGALSLLRRSISGRPPLPLA